MIRRPALLRRLRRDTRGVALLEFAFALPILLIMSLVGAELMNFIITRLRVSQMALHLADNAARMGTGSLLQAKTVNEADINDLLTGTGLQSGELDIYKNGRVFVTSVEPVANPNPTNKYRMRWSRCRGDRTSYAPQYKRQGMANTTNESGFGPDGKVNAAPDSATMFVEVYYEYTPLIKITQYLPQWTDDTKIVETASMMVRDRRDLAGGTNGVYQVSGVTPSTCT